MFSPDFPSILRKCYPKKEVHVKMITAAGSHLTHRAAPWLLSIERIKALGEPAVDRSEKIACFIPLALIAREPSPCSLPRAIWVYLARNALILSAPSPICAIPLRWPFGPVNVPLSTDVPAAAIF